MKIVFMGTPQFAVPSLDILLENGYDIVGVITAPDRLGGRGRNKVIESDIKKYAISKGLRILQPTNLKNEKFQDDLRTLNAQLQFVVAFRMLPSSVWDMPPLGTYNLHGSLLPSFRGAAPINWAIMSGAKMTGVTTFKLKHEIDTGDIAFTEEVPITDTDTAGSLHDKMMITGSQLVLKTVNAISDDTLVLKGQDNSLMSKAPKIFHETCELDFTKDVLSVYDHIRGLSPYPLSWMTYLDKKLKIIFGTPIIEKHNHSPGEIITDYRSYMHLVCKNGYINLEEIQYEGKKRMKTRDFLNGMGARMKTLLTQ
ncbi:MAG: methionyl-tRNA formyltransferase [Saprospiraceae bacterium]|nr:methionyl-tRNA formyltransferase [Saprospiraceae bacterium]